MANPAFSKEACIAQRKLREFAALTGRNEVVGYLLSLTPAEKAMFMKCSQRPQLERAFSFVANHVITSLDNHPVSADENSW
jgi:hypothetical protein